jgi:hypothetical protein
VALLIAEWLLRHGNCSKIAPWSPSIISAMKSVPRPHEIGWATATTLQMKFHGTAQSAACST